MSSNRTDMSRGSHIFSGLRLSSTSSGRSRQDIPAEDEAVIPATALGALTLNVETDRQPQGRKRKADAFSEDSDRDGDDASDVDPPSSDEEPRKRKRNKGKEREHTPDEDDSPAESMQDLKGSGAGTGETEDDDDSDLLEWEEEELDEDDDGPVYHYAIWNRLLNLASRAGSYASPPVGGEDNEDITSFIACSATWGRERANRPPSLSLWMPPPSQNNPNYDVEALTYKNRLVLDWKGDLIRRFIELPATISSNVEGWRTEAWIRNDPRVTYGDIVARMRTKEGAHGRVPIFDNRALATRTSNFRDHAGSVSWRDRASQARSRAFMDNLRTPAQRANNMTTDLDLTPAQRAAFYSMSRKLVSRRVTAGNAVPSTSSNVAGSSKSGASRSHGKATNRSATESDVPTLSAPTQYFDLTMISEQSQQGSSEIEAGEHSEHARYDNSRDEEVLETYPIYEGEEEAEWPFEFFETGDSDDPSSNSSISSGPDNPNDARNHIPEGMSEAMMLRAALVATVDHFRRLTGQYPVTTDPMENYFSQWAAYHYQLATFLRAQGRNDNQITLFGLAEWVGGISNWKSARPAIDEGTQENEGL